jgi:medium-chain acyl-[acyl-carrier-protein] hydrolase
MVSSPWLAGIKPNRTARIRLFCFPYAGGTAQIYSSWAQQLPSSVDVCPVQPPGRASRFYESPFSNLLKLVEAAAESLNTYMDLPFAFFGHSLGALVSFELARFVRNQYALSPSLLLVSACRAPHLPYEGHCPYDLPDAEFLERIYRFNGTPKEVHENAELMQLMVPLLRADFAMDQTYHYSESEPLDCPIIAFGGQDDNIVSRESLEAWREQTNTAFSAILLPGNHFFIGTARDPLLNAISTSLVANFILGVE